MASIPNEILEDVLLPLDRWNLDGVQFTSRRFHLLINKRMPNVCLRRIFHAFFEVTSKTDSEYSIYSVHRPTKRVACTTGNAAELFVQFVQSLRNSEKMRLLSIRGLEFTPSLVGLIQEVPMDARMLLFKGSNLNALTPKHVSDVILHFSPSCLDLTACYLRTEQVSFDLVRSMLKSGVLDITFTNRSPTDGGRFSEMNQALLGFCTDTDDQRVNDDGEEAFSSSDGTELRLSNGVFTKDLFKGLVEASRTSPRTRPLRIVVSPVHLEDEDLRAYAHNFSENHHGQRIYKFSGEEDGVDAVMDLRIVLKQHGKLTMLRTQRHNEESIADSDD